MRLRSFSGLSHRVYFIAKDHSLLLAIVIVDKGPRSTQAPYPKNLIKIVHKILRWTEDDAEQATGIYTHIFRITFSNACIYRRIFCVCACVCTFHYLMNTFATNFILPTNSNSLCFIFIAEMSDDIWCRMAHSCSYASVHLSLFPSLIYSLKISTHYPHYLSQNN